MPVPDLLDGLLEELRGQMATDTAAVLLLDDSGDYLVATAARGLEEEVRQGSRVPVGLGFAGRIAAERRPVAIEEVNPATVVNPVLLYKGVRSMLGAPLLDQGELLGVMHVGTLTQRHFTDADTGRLQQVADKAAHAIVTEQRRIDSAAAEALQRSLSPGRLPRIPGVELAARYVPGSRSGVGGDWYDVFPLDEHRFGIAIGDVMGHGLRAATTMGRLRSVLRAHAMQTYDPAEALSRLDAYVHQFERGLMASAIYGVLDSRDWRIRLSSAGHPAPLIIRPDQAAEPLHLPGDLLLGVDAGVTRKTIEVELPPGGSICQFTDGLVERRGGPETSALEQVSRRLARGDWTAEAACAEIMARMVGDDPAEDDVALLVVRRLP